MTQSQYEYLLFPGRQQAITKFQVDYLKKQLGSSGVAESAQVVWAVTSANHGGTRRNPISGERRLCMVEAVATGEGIPSLIFPIANMQQRPNFAHYVVEDIRRQTLGRVAMNAGNTLVLCSTPDVAADYRRLGYAVDTVELDESTGQFAAARPWDVIEQIIANGENWENEPAITELLAAGCLAHYQKYGLGQQIIDIFRDPLTGTDGDITETRDYDSYIGSFEQNAARKVEDFKQYVQPGRVLDIGCASGETLRLLSREPRLFESDFFGVEATQRLYQQCEQRQANGAFGDANVFFYQRNIMQPDLFPPEYFDTAISMALTHEIESYSGHAELEKFARRIAEMLKPGGVYINYDVVGPRDRTATVYAKLTEDDGDNPEDLHPELEGEDLAKFLATLSSRARFRRFARDFRAAENDRIDVRYETIDGQEYAVLTRGDLCEFLAHKDYLQSWRSEMHERFCFFSYDDWVKFLTDAGLTVEEGSRPIVNDWLIKNRFAPAAQVFRRDDNGDLQPADDPETNILLIAKKPE